MKLQKPPVASLALERGVPLFQPEKLDAAFLETIRALEPAIGVVVAYGKILRRSLLELPPHGFINVHASLLPRYRGAAPIQRAIEEGERETGVTIMRVDEQLDHGPIILMRSIEIGADERSGGLFQRLAEEGGRLLVEALDAIEGGTAREEEQQHELATYAHKIEKEEGRIDWSAPARSIFNRWRAFDPWPGAFFEIDGEIVKVNEMALSGVATDAAAGKILSIDGDSVTVATGEGALELRRMQRAGKKPTAASEVMRSLSLERGAALR